MQKFAIRLILLLSILFFATQKSIADTYPKREFRGVWFTTVWGNDWPSNPGTSNQSTQKAELLKYIDALEDLNISTICFQVRGMSDAMYQSSTLPDGLQIPWSQYLSGTNNRGVSPGWDPLAYVVQECHNRGIEVYAWINPFRWANGSTEWTTTYDKTIKNKGWLMSNGTTTVLNPGIPEVRQHITYICKDIISRYGIEGIIFDDYFYPNGGTPETSEAPDYTHWINSGTSLSFGDWRRQNVDLTIESIYNMIQETRPEVRLVAGPSPLAGASASKYGLTLWPNGYDNQYSTLYSDPLSWMDKRIVDMMATQIYWHRDHKLAPYNTITDWWYSLAKHFDLHNCVSMNVYDFETTMSNQADLGKTTAHYDEHVANILASREYAAKYGVKSTGVNFYDTRHLVSVKSGYDYQEHGQYLRDNCFQRKSITPEIHWKNTPIYNAVNNLAYSSGTLSWTAAPIPTGAHSLTTIRYTVYAIPNSVSYEAASTDDGFSVEYLQGITYSPNYTLSSDKRSGYWYAVCVFDGFGNEHAPAIYNYTGGTSAKTTLTSPSNGSSANWDQSFSWNVIPGATYHLQISTFENFSNILIDQPNLSTNSVTINLENLVEGETYYWKVTTQENGKTATDSEIFSFSVTTLTNSPLAQLESPQNNATLSSSTTFSWSNDDEHVTSFTFQIASDASFSNIINSQDIDKASDGPTSTTIDIKGMDAGTYYWRVTSKGRIYIDTPSEYRTFIVASLPSIEFSLISPDNNAQIENTQTFEWDAIDGASYLFEIATTEDFRNVIKSENLSSNNYELTVDELIFSPTYFWRVTAFKDGYKNTTSAIRTFAKSLDYNPAGNLSITPIWNHSINSEGLPKDLSGDNMRSMTAHNGKIYVAKRTSTNELQLLEFSANTGVLVNTITLTGDCTSHSSYGANGIFVDDANNLCITSIGMSAGTPLTVCTIDPDTYETKNVFSYGEASLRIDYANALGDVTKTGGQIWAAASSSGSAKNNYVYRWTRQSDGTWKTEYTIINTFNPTSATGVGSAPWVMPLPNDKFIVDGSSNFPTLYTFNVNDNATYESGFADDSECAPINFEGAGMAQITIGQTPLFIYSNETSAANGYSFNIVHNPSSFDFSKMEKYWTIPKVKLGDENHPYVLNSIATIDNNDGSVTIFVYAPKNGLAAYRISLPDMPITLNSPIDNVQTEDGFDFMWTGVEGASYTIELSATPTFDEITYSATTNNNIYSSNNITSLPNSTTYYWRIKASHNNYTTTTSAVESFITPAKPSICKPVHYLPNDKESLNSDIVFVAIKAYLVNVNTTKLELADNSILEISTDKDFTNIIYTNNQWVDVSVNGTEYECIQHTLPISYFTNGTYYWRIHAQEEGYDDVYSEPYSFVVTGQSDIPDNEENYTIEREDNADYPSITEVLSSGKNTWQLTNLWIRNSEKNHIDRWGSYSTDYRGFCTRHDHNGDQDGKDLIWIARHTDSKGYLEKYDASTGEYLGILELSGTYEKSTFPCNDVFVDDGGNLCIMNLKNSTTTKDDDLEIVVVDPKTGAVQDSPRFRVSLAGVRIDHANIVGDITSGEAYIFGATSNENANVYRWKLDNGVLINATPTTNKIATFYPSKTSGTTVKMLGTAARIYPINKDYFYVDGAGTSFTLYKFNEGGSNATLTSSFEAYAPNNDINPISNHGNGGTFFFHDGIPFIIYNHSSFSSNSPTSSDINYKYNLAKVVSHTSWETITKYWRIPNDNIGTLDHTSDDFGMLVDYLQYDALTGLPKGDIATYSNGDSFDRTNIYIYVPGNGMAAYSLSRHIDIFTGAEGLNSENINININAQKITFGCEVDNAQIYTLSGMMVNSAENASSIESPAAKGVYILRLTINGVTTTHKIVI